MTIFSIIFTSVRFSFVTVMQRFLVSILLMLYTVASSGLLFQLHYCNGNLESVRINAIEKVACCCTQNNSSAETTHVKAADDCCENTVVKAEIETQQSIPVDKWIPHNTNAFLPSVIDYPIINSALFDTATMSVIRNNGPPLGLWENIPLYLLHHNLKLYADLV
jgi:hypothetical protein